MSVPLLGRPFIALVALVYLALLLLIGGWAARRTRDARDFFVAGQRAGLWLTGMATMSAAFSSFVFLGGPGLTYRMGLGSLMIVLPVGFTSALLCWLLGRRLRLLAGAREIFTMADVVACRFRSPRVSALCAIAVLAGTVAYLGLQVQTLGILIRAIFGLERLDAALAIGLGVLVAYSVVGGMVAGLYTDLLQGGLMLVTALAVFAHALSACGGFGEMTGTLAASERFGREFLEPLGRAPVFTAFGFFFVFGIGVLGQPHLLHKFFMIDDARKLKWMPLMLGGSQSLCLLIWLGLGLAVPALVARGRLEPLLHADDAAPSYLLQVAPEWIAGLALVGILAAIMSTADSFLNIGSAALVRDLPRALGFTLGDQLWWGRAAVLGIAAAAAGFALAYGSLIALLGTFAFGIFGAALAPALAVGLNWNRVGAGAAGASMATGLVLTLLLEFLARQRWFDGLPRLTLPHGVMPAAVALAASFTVLFVVSWWRGPDRGIEADVRRVMELPTGDARQDSA